MLIVVLAAGLLTQFFPCCAFAIRSFSKVSATPELCDLAVKMFAWRAPDPGLNPTFSMELFPGQVVPVTRVQIPAFCWSRGHSPDSCKYGEKTFMSICIL